MHPTLWGERGVRGGEAGVEMLGPIGPAELPPAEALAGLGVKA